MKKLLHLTLLLSITCFAQPEKDSLLARDHDKVIRQLKMMRYLDSIALKETINSGNGTREIHTSFYRFYLDTIAGKSPFGFRETADYLGYKSTTGPGTFKDFRSRVYSRNIDNVLELTLKYGYISRERLKRPLGEKFTSLMTYVSKDDANDKKLKKLFAQEYNLANMPEAEYEFFKYIVQRKGELTNTDIKKLEKHGAKLVTEKVE
jgi:hypothetical protein